MRRCTATFEEAAIAILAILADREWHSRSAEIGQLGEPNRPCRVCGEVDPPPVAVVADVDPVLHVLPFRACDGSVNGNEDQERLVRGDEDRRF
jgi:hypothetical protein